MTESDRHTTTRQTQKKATMTNPCTTLLLCIGIAMTSGCASMLCKPTATVTVFGNAPAAKVTVKNGDDIIAKQDIPTKLHLSSTKNYSVQFDKTGAAPLSASLTRSMNAPFIVNIVLPIGFIVDACTGTMRTIADSAFYVDFTPTSGSASAEDMQTKLNAITVAKGSVVGAESYNFNTRKSEYPSECEDTFTVGVSTVQDLLVC